MSSLLGVSEPISPPPRPELGSSQNRPAVPEPPTPEPLVEFHSSPAPPLAGRGPPPHAGRETSVSRPSTTRRPTDTILSFIGDPPGWGSGTRRMESRQGKSGNRPSSDVEG